jgi:hypothetical protein
MWIEIFVVDGKVKHVGYYTGTPIGVLFHIYFRFLNSSYNVSCKGMMQFNATMRRSARAALGRFLSGKVVVISSGKGGVGTHAIKNFECYLICHDRQNNNSSLIFIWAGRERFQNCGH